MAKDKNVDLVISAKDEATATLGKINKAVRDFNKAQREAGAAGKSMKGALSSVQAAAKETVSSIGKLEAENRSLANEQNKQVAAAQRAKAAFLAQREELQKQRTALSDLKTAVLQPTKAYTSLTNQIGKTEGILSRMNAAQAKRASSLADMQAKVASSSDAEGRLAAKIAATQGVMSRADDAIAKKSAELQKLQTTLAGTNKYYADAEQKVKAQTAAVLKAKGRTVELKTAWNEATTAVATGAKAMATATEKNNRGIAALNSRMELLSGASIRTATSMQKVVAAQNATSNQAGKINSNTQAMNNNANATNNAGNAKRKFKKDSDDAGNSLDRFTEKSRKSMSVVQRLRGQILSLGAAYFGLYGAINQLQQVYTTAVSIEGAKSRLQFAAGGDAKQAEADMAYIRQLSDTLGVEFKSTLAEFSKFNAAASATNLAGEKSRFIFTQMTKAGRALRLTNEELSGTFLALTQMISKGKITAEELNQQLGERFPGSAARLAKSLGLVEKDGVSATGQLFKLMEQGKVSADALVYFARMVGEETEPVLNEAVNAIDANMNRLRNSIMDMQLQFAAGGFLEELNVALKDMNLQLSDPKAQEGMRNLGSIVGNLVSLIPVLVRNIDKISAAVSVLLGLGLFRYLSKLGVDIVQVTAAMGRFFLGIGATAEKAGFLVRALAAVGGAFTTLAGGIAIAIAALGAGIFLFNSEWANENISWVRDVKDRTEYILNDLKLMFRNTVANIEEAFSKGWDSIVSTSVDKFRGLAQAVQEIQESIVNNLIAGIESAWNAVTGLAEKGAQPRQAYREAGSDSWRGQASRKEVTDPKLVADRQRVLDEQAKLDAKYDNLTVAQKKARNDQLHAMEEKAIADRRKLADEERQKRKNAEAKAAEDAKKAQEAELQARLDALNVGRAGITDGLKPITEGTDKAGEAAAKKAASLKERLDREMEGVAAKTAQYTADVMEKSLEAISQKVQAQYSKLLTDLQKAGRNVDAEQVRQLIKIETLAKQDEWKSKAIGKKESEINDLLNTRGMIMQRIQYLQTQLGTGSPEVQGLITQLNDMDATIQRMINGAIAFAQSIGDDRAVQRLQVMAIQVKQLEQGLISADQVNQTFASTATTGLDSMAKAFGDVINGTHDLKSGFQGAADAFRTFASDFLRQIANMIIQQTILRSLQGGTFGSTIAGLFNHTGGVVGKHGTVKPVSPSWFGNAVRYHTGGVAGLKPDEVPTVLQKGEEVLTRDDPRHRYNQQAQQTSGNVKIINTIDSASVVSEGLSTPSGEKAIINVIRANKSTFRNILK